jgi:hypothetical protein
MTPARLAACCITLSLAATAAWAQPAGVLHVQRAEIVDRQGFEKPLVAATMMVPAGWRTQGDVAWNPGVRCGPAYALRLRAQAADGSAAIELLPGEMWAASDMGAGECPAGNWRDVREYLTGWVQRHRPGARWIDYRPRPDKSQPEQQFPMPGGGGMSTRVEGGQALIAYSQGGREVRETLVSIVSITRSQMAGFQPGSVIRSLHGQAHGVLLWRAPEGKLDLRQFDAVWASWRRGSEWQARISQAEGQMARENAATQARISQIQAEGSRQTLAEIARRGELAAQSRAEVAAINQGTWQAGQASQDRRHTDSVRLVREVEAWRAPGGSTVELPAHYPHAWQLRDGTYLLTDNAQFDPGRDIGQPGVALTRPPR